MKPEHFLFTYLPLLPGSEDLSCQLQKVIFNICSVCRLLAAIQSLALSTVRLMKQSNHHSAEVAATSSSLIKQFAVAIPCVLMFTNAAASWTIWTSCVLFSHLEFLEGPVLVF